MKLKNNSLIAVDLDGTLCEGEFWGDGEPIPRLDMIALIEKIYKQGHHIIIYTARHRKYYQQTESWLIKHGVYYHALSMEKMGADLYIDDKCIHCDDFLQEFNN